MRVQRVIMFKPGWQQLDDGVGVRRGIERHVVSFESPYEGLRHAVGLQAFDLGAQGMQADVASKSARLSRRIARAVIGEPFDGAGQPVETTEALFHDLTIRSRISSLLMPSVVATWPMASLVAAIESKGDANTFGIVAGDFKAVGIPPEVRPVDGDTRRLARIID
jgi:hypothetical protein